MSFKYYIKSEKESSATATNDAQEDAPHDESWFWRHLGSDSDTKKRYTHDIFSRSCSTRWILPLEAPRTDSSKEARYMHDTLWDRAWISEISVPVHDFMPNAQADIASWIIYAIMLPEITAQSSTVSSKFLFQPTLKLLNMSLLDLLIAGCYYDACTQPWNILQFWGESSGPVSHPWALSFPPSQKHLMCSTRACFKSLAQLQWPMPLTSSPRSSRSSPAPDMEAHPAFLAGFGSPGLSFTHRAIAQSLFELLPVKGELQASVRHDSKSRSQAIQIPVASPMTPRPPVQRGTGNLSVIGPEQNSFS